MATRLAAFALIGVIGAAGTAAGQAMAPPIPSPREPGSTGSVAPTVPPPGMAPTVPPPLQRAGGEAGRAALGPEDAAEVRALCRVAPDWRLFQVCHRLRGAN